MFLLQILFGNVACDHVPRLAGKSVSGSAYCQARGRLPLEALQTLLTRSTSAMSAAVRDTGRWLGHRLLVMEGSSFSMPDTEELRDHFGQSGGQAAGCGFPTAHWLALVHLGSGLFQKVIAAPLRTHDMSGAALELRTAAIQTALEAEGWQVKQEGWKVKVFRRSNPAENDYETEFSPAPAFTPPKK
jgi:hypothetical protein